MKKHLAAFSIALTLLASGAAAQTINNLGAGAAVSGTDMFPAYQGANPAKRVSAAQINTYVQGLWGAGCATFLTTPSSANLRGCLTDEVGTGAFYTVGGALGTPASATLTNGTGLPISTGLTGAGTGVLTALGVNVGTAGAFVVNGGALGTPSSGTATNLTGTASGLTAGAVSGGAIQPVSGTSSTVPGMTAGSAVADTDLFYASQSSGTNDRKVTGAQLKTYANGTAVVSLTSTSETIQNSYQNKLVRFCNASPVAASIAQAGSGGNFGADWAVSLKNDCAGTVTLTATTSTFNPGTGGAGTGTSTITLLQGQGVDLYSNGTDYEEQPGKGGAASGAAGGELQGTYPNPTLAYPNASGFGSAKRRFYTYNDCITPTNTVQTFDWSSSPAGTGSGLTILDYGSTNAVSVCSLDLGTTTSGRSTIWGAASGAPARAITFGRGRARIVIRLAIHVLSDGTDTYTTRIGFINSQTGNSSNGAYFRYTHGTNGGRWQAVTVDNSTESTADTGVTPVADTYQEFMVDVNAAGTSAVFSIDGSTVATINTNIPTTAGRQVTYGAIALKSAGTTATSGGYVDYIEVQQDLTTAR